MKTDDETVRAAVAGVLLTCGPWMTARDIGRHIGCDGASVKRVLDGMRARCGRLAPRDGPGDAGPVHDVPGSAGDHRRAVRLDVEGGARVSRFSDRREEAKAVKDALRAAGFADPRVKHGRGTAWNWLYVELTMPAVAHEHADGWEGCGSQGYTRETCAALRAWGETYDRALALAQATTGRAGEYHGEIRVTVERAHNVPGVAPAVPSLTVAEADGPLAPAETHDALLERIAREHLGVPTLATRSSDDLDFHDVNVSGLRRALEAAYLAGAFTARAKDVR
jgi:hypothetical protein